MKTKYLILKASSLLATLFVITACSTSSNNNVAKECDQYKDLTKNKEFNLGKVHSCKGEKEVSEKLFAKSCKAKFAMGCSALAYSKVRRNQISHARVFYQKGCSLGDKTSCYNLKNLPDPGKTYMRKANQYLGTMSADRIQNCFQVHENNGYALTSRSQIDKKMQMIRYSVIINNQGRPYNIKVESKLGKNFRKCAMDVLNSITFKRPPRHLRPRLQTLLTLHTNE
jgi:hypothetical protein